MKRRLHSSCERHRPSVFTAILLLTAALLAACSVSDAVDVARIAAGDRGAAVGLARRRALRYATHPTAIAADFRRFKKIVGKFRRAVGGIWGRGDAREPQPKEYVKYTQNYLSRASVDFEHGVIIIETLDKRTPERSLREAIVTTLLTPYDPRAVDLYSAGPVRLGGTPFLLGEVRDARGRDIRTEAQAEAFAQHLLLLPPQERPGPGGRIVRYVVIPLVPNHMMVRAAKFRPLVEEAARRFGVRRALLYAVIRVESDFNPYAINAVPAVGLMQVVPRTAGAEVHAWLTGRNAAPSTAFLFEPDNNVAYGAAYLHLLDRRHLASVRNPLSREYCVIAAYNGGSGALLATFGRGRSAAFAAINGRPPLEVYTTIESRHRAQETRDYLKKVLAAEKEFAGL